MNLAAANPEVLTVKEVSDLLRLRPSTVYKMIRQGRIPCFRSDQIGNGWRFRKDVILRWIGGL
jgi:excisionase family DNA binding protein